IRPVFEAGKKLKLSPTADDLEIREWDVTILSVFMPGNFGNYLKGEEFRERLKLGIVLAFAANNIKLPAIDITFLGAIATKATSVEARIRSNALLIGFNIDNEDYTIAGRINDLEDLAGEFAIAGVINADAINIFLEELHQEMINEADKHDATLTGFSAECHAGYLLVRGRARKFGNWLDFSFRLVPTMYHTRPGKYFSYLSKPRKVNSRTYPALGFRAEDVHVDPDRAWWTILFGEVIFGILSGGNTFLIIESLFFYAGNVLTANIQGRTLDNPPARIVKNNPPAGGISTRVALELFDIRSEGIFTGISFQKKLSEAMIHGPVLIPEDYWNDRLSYRIQLPSSAFEKDPALRVQWRLINQSNGGILINTTNKASGHLKFQFSASDFPSVRKFEVQARIFRQHEAFITEISNTSLPVITREALQPNTYIRWHSTTKAPDIAFDTDTREWIYRGESRVTRWSEWHRLDNPCKAVHATNRYRYQTETANRLPYNLERLEDMRPGLCPYCFFGSPAGINAAF
ncbi:MAG: hypothetical protein JST02_05595, partial [Bacteroidetes bacterium]|nr:hypothetical protein [Bacteroidota bacterium]